MTRILFMIHGMGKHSPGWSQRFVDQLRELSDGFQAFKDDPALFDSVQVEEISYDGEIDRWLEKFAQDANGLRTFIRKKQIPLAGSSLEGLLGWLGGAATKERDFFWESAIDVLLWRFSRALVATDVTARVLRQLFRPLKKALEDGGEAQCSVLAHSLGTSVLHDALARMAAEGIDGEVGFKQQVFDNLFMVANVSRALETDYPVEQSLVRPKTAAAFGDCQNYHNFRHVLDPFPAVKPFRAPAQWVRFHAVEDLDHVQQLNVHALDHYLLHPQVHVPILRDGFGALITQDEEELALAKFRPLALPDKVVDAYRKRFNAAVPPLAELPDPMDFVKLACQYRSWI